MDKNIKLAIKAYSELYGNLKKAGNNKKISENDFTESRKVKKYLERSKDDFLLANAVKKLIETSEIRLELGLPQDYQNLYHWLIIISYYSMYHAATAAIAKKMIKCESHEATIASLAKHYATGEDLEFDFIKTLKYIYITYIESGRDKRRGAQYNVDEQYSKQAAYEVFDDAKKFVKRLQELLEDEG